MELVKAVREQADAVRELGGFGSDDDCEQFTRDAIDAARKLYVAEQILSANSLLAAYKRALKTGEISDV